MASGPQSWDPRQQLIDLLVEKMAPPRCSEVRRHMAEYVALPWLLPEHQAWGKVAQRRVSSVCPEPADTLPSTAAPMSTAATRSNAAPRAAQARRGAGTGFLLGGAVPTGLGAFALGFYSTNPDSNAGALSAGVPLLVAGLSLEVAGILLVASSAPRHDGLSATPSSTRAVGLLAPIVSIDPVRGDVAAGVAGRF